MKLYFYTIILSLLVSMAYLPKATAEDSDQLQWESEKVRDYLSGIEEIRVWFGATNGFGHQSHGLAVMNRLVDLGFSGNFRVVYHDLTGDPRYSNRKKLGYLFPGYNPYADFQEITPRVSIESEQYFQEAHHPQVQLAVTGGDDVKTNVARRLRSDFALVLQPQGWWLPSEVITYDGQRSTLAGITQLSTNLISKDPRTGLFPPTLNYSKTPHPRAEIHVEGILSVDTNKYGFMPWYGVNRMGNFELLYDVITTLPDSIHRRFPKGIIVPILDPESPIYFEPMGTIKHIEVTSPNLPLILQGMKQGDLTFIRVGALPSPQFAEFLKKANLPPVISGKNSKNLCEQLGKPYLSAIYLGNEMNGSELSFMNRSLRGRRTMEISEFLGNYLGDEGYLLLLAFLKDALDPKSLLMEEVQLLAQTITQTGQDKVLQALAKALPVLNKQEACHLSFLSHVKKWIKALPLKSKVLTQ